MDFNIWYLKWMCSPDGSVTEHIWFVLNINETLSETYCITVKVTLNYLTVRNGCSPWIYTIYCAISGLGSLLNTASSYMTFDGH